jgi:hypothetical protein
MQHTVIAFFDIYSQAEQARDMLVGAGIPAASIALQARSEPTYATDATTAGEPSPAGEGFLANIERFFESLFAKEPPQRETGQYAEVMRRGAVMLSVDAATDVQCDLAKKTLAQTNPIDIDERAATWSAPSEDATRDHSLLDELGIRRSASDRSGGTVQSFARRTDAGAKGIGSAPSHATSPPEQTSTVPDEYLQGEENFEDKGHGTDSRS